jgi:hypothetical protein
VVEEETLGNQNFNIKKIAGVNVLFVLSII